MELDLGELGICFFDVGSCWFWGGDCLLGILSVDGWDTCLCLGEAVSEIILFVDKNNKAILYLKRMALLIVSILLVISSNQ